jgi:hypothetical protein
MNMSLPHAAIFGDDNPHSHPLPDALALIGDPSFPDLWLFDEMTGAYGLSPTLALWSVALPLWRAFQESGPFAQSDIDSLGGAAA